MAQVSAPLAGRCADALSLRRHGPAIGWLANHAREMPARTPPLPAARRSHHRVPRRRQPACQSLPFQYFCQTSSPGLKELPAGTPSRAFTMVEDRVFSKIGKDDAARVLVKFKAGLDSMPGSGGGDLLRPHPPHHLRPQDRWRPVAGDRAPRAKSAKSNATMLYSRIRSDEDPRRSHAEAARAGTTRAARRSSRWRFIPPTRRCNTCPPPPA